MSMMDAMIPQMKKRNYNRRDLWWRRGIL